VGEVVRRQAVYRIGLAACLLLTSVRTAYFLHELNPPSEQSEIGQLFRAEAAMNDTLQHVPDNIRQVYVLASGSLVPVNPVYLSALLELRAEVIRIIDLSWSCTWLREPVAFERRSVDGFVTLSLEAPGCARFYFAFSGINGDKLIDGRIDRNDSISYELPEARVDKSDLLILGRRIMINVRPRGPARFITDFGEGDGGIRWFDVP